MTPTRDGGTGSGVPRALVVTADPGLLDELLRLAAVAGAEVDVAPDGPSARPRWHGAACVVVGPDAAPGCVRARLPRRPGVLLLGDLDDAGVWQLAVELGAERVEVLPDGEEALVGHLAEATEPRGADGAVVAVLGGRGGAGATTLACGLAVTATRLGLRALLVDGDPLGGGIDLVFGGEQDRGLRWPDLGATSGRVPADALRDALPHLGGLAVLSWDRGSGTAVPASAMSAVLTAGCRAHDLVVVDLPRTPDEATRVVLEAASRVLLVVPAELRAAAAAGRVAAATGVLCRDLGLVVRTPGPAGLDAATMAGLLGLRLAGQLRSEPRLSAALERGEPPAQRGRGPLAQLCTRLVREIVPRPAWAA